MSSAGSPKPASPPAGIPGPLTPNAGVPGAQSTIEIDHAETVSTYTSSTVLTDTESLRSSILHYKWEHGRRYHAFQDGEYWAPNDDVQQDAEALQHEMFRRFLGGKLFLSPIGDNAQACYEKRNDAVFVCTRSHYLYGQSILDLGCGAGSWSIDVADELPSAEVLGIDLSPIQPQFVPPNCRFEVDDINDDWTLPENKFDLIFLRSLPGCVANMDDFCVKMVKYLKPGGWFEHTQSSARVLSDDGTVPPDSAMAQWYDIFVQIGDVTGKSFMTSETAPDSIRRAGFTNIQEHNVKIPIGTWPRDPVLKQWGAWNRIFLLKAIEGFSIRGLTTILGWSYEKAQLYLVQLRKEITSPNIHAYFFFRVVYGQKQPSDSN